MADHTPSSKITSDTEFDRHVSKSKLTADCSTSRSSTEGATVGQRRNAFVPSQTQSVLLSPHVLRTAFS